MLERRCENCGHLDLDHIPVGHAPKEYCEGSQDCVCDNFVPKYGE